MLSSLYIFDGHTNPISGSDINEVRYNTTVAPVTGHFVVRVPIDMPISTEPQTLLGLLTAKYASMLTYFATFANVAYEDFTTTPGVDTTNSPGASVGVRCTTKIGSRVGGVGGILRTNNNVIGSTPSICSVTWEAFEIVNANPSTGRLTQTFQVVPSSRLTAEVSFNNGATWTAVTDRAIQNIGVPDQGSNLVLRFTNVSSPMAPVWLGSWAVLF